LAAENPQSAGVQEQLARGLALIGEEQAAARTFEGAADKAHAPGKQQTLLAQSARRFAEANQDVETSRVVAKMRAAAEANPDLELSVLRTLADIAKNKGDLVGSIPALERIVQLVPDDYDAKFSLAYAHSQNANDPLALLHYLKIPEHERSGATWNNVGVSSDAQGLPARAVDAYRKAQDAQETLAMSNLAAKFLRAGFLTEAMSLCEQALKVEDTHKNVGLTWASTKELPDEERKRLDKILTDAGPISNFYRLVGRGEARSQPDYLPPTWIAPEAAVTVSIKGDAFIAEGSYEVPGFGGLLGSFTLAGPPPPVQKFRVTYHGILKGRTVHGRVNRRLESDAQQPPSLLSAVPEHPKILMLLTDDGSELKAMEQPNAGSVRFYSLRQQHS
jgi:tetratricopeptide (TPR) repeat protein